MKKIRLTDKYYSLNELINFINKKPTFILDT